MDENEKNFSINAEDLKKETSETVNQVKDTIKNVDFKEDSREARSFFLSFFKNPLGEIKKATESTDSKFIKVAIIIFVIWLAIILAANLINTATNYLLGTFGSFSYFFSHLFHNIFNLAKDLIAPVITILTLSGLIYGFKKVKNRSFLTIASSILITKIPVVIATIVSLLTIFNTHFLKISSTFAGFCDILSTVLLFFTMKNLSEEDKNDSYFWKFASIMGIFYIVKSVCSYLGIYL